MSSIWHFHDRKNHKNLEMIYSGASKGVPINKDDMDHNTDLNPEQSINSVYWMIHNLSLYKHEIIIVLSIFNHKTFS